jgi:hypothetical protein
MDFFFLNLLINQSIHLRSVKIYNEWEIFRIFLKKFVFILKNKWGILQRHKEDCHDLAIDHPEFNKKSMRTSSIEHGHQQGNISQSALVSAGPVTVHNFFG